MARGWALRVLACLAAVTVLVGGCSEKHEPSTSAPATSAKATPTLPPLGPADFPVPAEARQKTEAGVLAFSRYYIELSNRLLASLDSAPLRDLSRGCPDCDSMARGYDKAKTSGYTYQGGRLSITWISNAVIKGDTGEVAFLLEQATVTVKDADGNVIPDKSSAACQLNGGLAVAWDGARATWVVTNFTAERT